MHKSSNLLIFGIIVLSLFHCAASLEIPSQMLNMSQGQEGERVSEEILPGEIAEITVEHITLQGPFSEALTMSVAFDEIFLFIDGQGRLITRDSSYTIDSEAIALPSPAELIKLDVQKGESLDYILIRKTLSPQDKQDMLSFPAEHRAQIYFKRFEDCEAYTEPIKSPNTVSRTVLPKDYAARIALGTVATKGPDEVGAHEHPMLEQLFLGLNENESTVFADDALAEFASFQILHIPRGASHGARVAQDKVLYYMWMDFFQTKAGEEWLKTHEALDVDKKSK